MDEIFQIEVADLHRTGKVIKGEYNLSILREGSFSISVERLPLIEYFVFFDHPIKAEQIKVKVYKTLGGQWYDKDYSEEAEIYSPEFGLPEINKGIKKVIDMHESAHARVSTYI